MWIVRLALRRPYTFVVMALAIALLGGAAIYTMPVDIFPYIDIPVVSVIWTYQGISPEEMEKRIVTVYERALTTTVNDVEHIESQSFNGVAVVRIYFQPNAKVEMGLAQVTAISQTMLRILPPGIFPPSVIKYDASSVPILQLGLGSKTLSEQELFDLGQNFIRTQLATVQGAAVPLPFGGKMRQVMVDLDPPALYAYQLSASRHLGGDHRPEPDPAGRHGQDGRSRVPGEAQQQPAPAGRAERSAREDRQRRDGLPPGRRPGAGRLFRADQRGAHQRSARRAADGAAERQGLHAGHRQQGQSRLAARSSPASPARSRSSSSSTSRCSSARPSTAWSARPSSRRCSPA